MGQVKHLACGAIVTPLLCIPNERGSVYHGLKASEEAYEGFGEAYFSTVLPGATKGWKLHRIMTLNLIVPVGTIRFHLRSEKSEVTESVMLGDKEYARLTVPPGLWMAFSGVGTALNLLLNVASIEHDPDEAITAPLEQFPFVLANGEISR